MNLDGGGNSGPSGRKQGVGLDGIDVTMVGSPVGATKTDRDTGITDAMARGAEGTVIFWAVIGTFCLPLGNEDKRVAFDRPFGAIGGLRAHGFPWNTVRFLFVSTLTFAIGGDNRGLSCTALVVVFRVNFSFATASFNATEFPATPRLSNVVELLEAKRLLSPFGSIEQFGADKEGSYKRSSFLIWRVDDAGAQGFACL